VTKASELERIYAFLRDLDEGASTSTEQFELGAAFFNAELPHVYDRNFVLITNPDAQARPVLDAADRLQGRAGLKHRKVVFEPEPAGARVTSALAAAGWEQRRLSVMAFRGDPAALEDPTPADEAGEVDREALLPALEALIRTEPWGSDEEVVRQLRAADAAVARAVRQRCFARIVDGKVVASCRLFSDGSTAQVEDVATVPGHRQRGYAGAAVRRAVREALADHDLVFLNAVDGRWVKHWYERLGFEQVGLRYEATRTA
jgi:ribosomal protein S18 acetylase RimI-like enzyme